MCCQRGWERSQPDHRSDSTTRKGSGHRKSVSDRFPPLDPRACRNFHRRAAVCHRTAVGYMIRRARRDERDGRPHPTRGGRRGGGRAGDRGRDRAGRVPDAGRPGRRAGPARRPAAGGGRRRRLAAHRGRPAVAAGRGGPSARSAWCRWAPATTSPAASASRSTRWRPPSSSSPGRPGRSTSSPTTPAGSWSTRCTWASGRRRPSGPARSSRTCASPRSRSAPSWPGPGRPAGGCGSRSTAGSSPAVAARC